MSILGVWVVGCGLCVVVGVILLYSRLLIWAGILLVARVLGFGTWNVDRETWNLARELGTTLRTSCVPPWHFFSMETFQAIVME